MSQRDLARKAGINQSTLSLLENGKRRWPHPRVTLALAAALGIQFSALTEESG